VYEKKKPESFEDDIEDFLKFGINDRIKTTYEEYGYALYQLLLQEPITGFNFTRSGTEISQKRLIIIPHGILSRLPFEALLTREGNNQPYSQLPYLQNSVAVSYHFSATLWHEAHEDYDTDGDGYLDEYLCAGVSGATDCDDADAEIAELAKLEEEIQRGMKELEGMLG